MTTRNRTSEIQNPRLVLLCEYATLNGGERSMLATLEGVCEAGFRPIVMAPPQGPLAETLRSRGIELQPFETRDPAGNRRPVDRLRDELALRLRSLRPDLVHANSLAMGRLLGPVAAELRTPSVAHLRDILRLSGQAIADLNCHTRLLAVSDAVRRFHVAQGLTPERVHVLYNGVDVEKFRPRPRSGFLHRELGLAAEVPLLGTVGQISLRKGQDVLVRAARSAARHFAMVIVGQRFSGKDESREFEAQLRRAAEGELAGRLYFLGLREDVDRILNELTLLVHPARQEPLGRVLLEAAAAGCPVLATDVGGTREIFPPQCQTARLVPADDPAALAAAIDELLGNQTRLAQIAEAARRHAEEAFDHRTATRRLLEQYQGVLAERLRIQSTDRR